MTESSREPGRFKLGRVAVAADERTPLVDSVLRVLSEKGASVETYLPNAGETHPWPQVAQWLGGLVASGQCHTGVLFCWTGTGVSMAANKVPGIRAALCADAQTAAGARRWNDANVLVMSLRATSEAIAAEMLDAWFGTEPDPSEADNVAALRLMDRAPHQESVPKS